jgi:hypothetical protein
MLNPGTFIVNNHLLIHSSITLRGSGVGTTILRKTNGARPRASRIQPIDPGSYSYEAEPVVIVGPSRWPGPDNSTSRNLTVEGMQGSSSVTVANGSGFAAGQFVLLDELSGATWQPTPVGFPGNAQVLQSDRLAWNIHNPGQGGDDPNEAKGWFSRFDRPTNEIKEIASVSGNTISFTSPLTIGYRVSHSAQLTRYTPTGSQSTGNSVHVTNAGVEDLSMYGGADGGLRFENAAYSWAKNIEVTQWIGEGVAIDGSFRIEVRDSNLHTGSWPTPGGAGYIVSLANGSSEVLIENNILFDANKVMVFRCSGAGSVVGYNYTDDSWISYAPTWVEVGINASHMAGPHHVLFEGNYSPNADSDYTHGNSIYLTFFRNHLSGQRRNFTDTGNVRTVGLAYGAWWDSFVGNVLGRPGQMNGWRYTDSAMSCDASGGNCTGNNANWGDKEIWKLGYDPIRWSMRPDPKVLSTVIRDGNYDHLTNSQRWHNTPGGFAIPNSMYLTAKPAFFGSYPWPWVDPATGTIYTLPAKARYEGNPPPPPAPPPPAPPPTCTVASQLGDFNGDGRSDMLFRQDGNGSLLLYLMNGFQVLGAQVIGQIGLDWRLAGVRDVNGDGRADMLFHRTDGTLLLYLMNGTQVLGATVIGQLGTDWRFQGLADFNGDGRTDMLFRRTDGTLLLYLMNGFQVLGAQVIGQLGSDWVFFGANDFNGDGRADMLFRRTDGTLLMYLMNGFQSLGAQIVGQLGEEWRSVGVTDFNGDGRADMLFQRTDGSVLMYLMNGFQSLGGAGDRPAWQRLDTDRPGRPQWRRAERHGVPPQRRNRARDPDERVPGAGRAGDRPARQRLERLLWSARRRGAKCRPTVSPGRPLLSAALDRAGAAKAEKRDLVDPIEATGFPWRRRHARRCARRHGLPPANAG